MKVNVVLTHPDARIPVNPNSIRNTYLISSVDSYDFEPRQVIQVRTGLILQVTSPFIGFIHSGTLKTQDGAFFVMPQVVESERDQELMIEMTLLAERPARLNSRTILTSLHFVRSEQADFDLNGRRFAPGDQ